MVTSTADAFHDRISVWCVASEKLAVQCVKAERTMRLSDTRCRFDSKARSLANNPIGLPARQA